MSSKGEPADDQSEKMAAYRSIYDENEEQQSRFLQKAKENPFIPLGIAGGLGAVGYSIYNYKRSNLKLSLYLIQTRVAAQSAVIGCIALGVAYHLITDSLSGSTDNNHKK